MQRNNKPAHNIGNKIRIATSIPSSQNLYSTHSSNYSLIMIIDHFYSATYSTSTQSRSRLQHGYCISVSRRSAQATVSEGLAQGPYMAAKAGVEPMTPRLKVIDSTKAPPCL